LTRGRRRWFRRTGEVQERYVSNRVQWRGFVGLGRGGDTPLVLEAPRGTLDPWTLVVVVVVAVVVVVVAVEGSERRDREIPRVSGVGGENGKYLCESL
jgi:hypothetical protein